VKISDEARAKIDELPSRFRSKKRSEAARIALCEAAHLIAGGKGLPAPWPYPDLAREGEKWVRAGRYRIAYSTTTGSHTPEDRNPKLARVLRQKPWGHRSRLDRWR
jgi:hypothetical protein